MGKLQEIIKINSKDNVLVALRKLKKGSTYILNNKEYLIQENIDSKHKFAMKNFDIGDAIYMYGVLVGKATKKILKGGLITQNNIKHSTTNFCVPKKKQIIKWIPPNISKFKTKTFQGYHRKDGKVGTENNWLIIPLVFCENRNVEIIKKALLKKLGFEKKDNLGIDVNSLIEDYKSGASINSILEKNIIINSKKSSKNKLFPNVDGIKFLTHNGGCGGTRSDSHTLCKLFAGYINNPNVGGATVLSLGCQNAQISILKTALQGISPNIDKPIYYLEQQQSNSEKEFISEAIKKTFVGLIHINKFKRKPSPLNKLTIGLECGGSDGFSGISANPSLGYLSDLIVGLGGKALLAEFPELNGVEQELINRCINKEKAIKFSNIISSYNAKAIAVGSGFFANPSPGNIKDGLITDAIKSAGAAKKGGTSPINDVLDYTEQATVSGLNLLCTPGNDVESTTGLAGSGANIILFTTGLGTPTGNPITPVIKISSNTKLYKKMNDIIDFNAGQIIEGHSSIKDNGENLLNFLIKIASGEIETKAKKLEQNDFIPWKRDISL